MNKIVIFLSGLFLSSSMSAGELSPLGTHVAKIVRPPVQKGELASIVVGVITPKGQEAWGFGKERDDSKKVPDGDTIYMIGSVQKLFTGVMLAEMTLEKAVRLEQPITELMPKNRRIREKGRAITLVDLATHSSGLPANADNRPKVTGGKVNDQVQMQWIFDEANRILPKHAPGTHYEYSNFGSVLLQDLLSLKANKSFSTMTKKGIFEPLQMASTFSIPPSDAFSRIAQGHNKRNKAFAIQTEKNYQKAPVAQFYSTANDMMKFLAANMGLRASEIQAALEMTQVSRFQVKNKKSMGLFWHIKDGREYSKNGQSGDSGFHCLVIFDKARKYGAVVLSNTASGKVDELGHEIFKSIPQFL